LDALLDQITLDQVLNGCTSETLIFTVNLIVNNIFKKEEIDYLFWKE